MQLLKQITFSLCALLQNKLKVFLVNSDKFPKSVRWHKVCLRASLVHPKTISVRPLLNNINISEHIALSQKCYGNILHLFLQHFQLSFLQSPTSYLLSPPEYLLTIAHQTQSISELVLLVVFI